jgi:hypothetical protein
MRGMVPDLVKNLLSANAELQKHCASAIFKVNIKLNIFHFDKKIVVFL